MSNATAPRCRPLPSVAMLCAPLTHEDLCERARRWLRNSRRCDPVFSNIASCREIPDAIGWSGCCKWEGSTVVECKTSLADFYADATKYVSYYNPERGPDLGYSGRRTRWTAQQAASMGYVRIDLPRMGDFRFYLCEEGVLPLEVVQRHAPDHGLLYTSGRRVVVVLPAPRRELLVDKNSEIRYLRFAVVNRKSPYQPPLEAGEIRPVAGEQGGLFE